MKRLLILFLLTSTPGIIYAQVTPRQIAQVDSLVSFYVQDQNIPGMSISVFYKDGLVFSKGFGYSDIEAGTPVDPSNTKFRVGSVSKTYTAAALGELMEDGVIHPDSSVYAYVPDFPEKRHDFSVRQLAGHTAGIRHYRGSEFISKRFYATVDEGLEIFENDTLLFEPGTDYRYSSYGWNLISAVIEGASGEAFLEFITREVFDELGMKSTVPEWSNQTIPHLTTFYEYRNNQNVEADFVDNSYKWAGGGFVGTTEDMIRFGRAYLSTDFQPSSVQKDLTTPLILTNGRETGYGMGWSTWERDGSTWVGHTGGSMGGSTMFIMNKEHDMIIAFAINRSGVSFKDLHFRLAYLLMN
ncbi:MAG: serine hydrolase domain-containing protein [Bacteroidota bacterium]